MTDPVTTIESLVSLDYERPLTLASRQYLAAIREGRILGHRCPSCGRIFTPPKGYCPICTVQTGEADEIELSPTGTLVGFSILNPDSLHKGDDSVVRGTVQLDGSDVTLTGELTDVTPDDALAEAGPKIEELRADARRRKGWIMDTYLLRRRSSEYRWLSQKPSARPGRRGSSPCA